MKAVYKSIVIPMKVQLTFFFHRANKNSKETQRTQNSQMSAVKSTLKGSQHLASNYIVQSSSGRKQFRFLVKVLVHTHTSSVCTLRTTLCSYSHQLCAHTHTSSVGTLTPAQWEHSHQLSVHTHTSSVYTITLALCAHSHQVCVHTHIRFVYILTLALCAHSHQVCLCQVHIPKAITKARFKTTLSTRVIYDRRKFTYTLKALSHTYLLYVCITRR